MLLAVEEGGEGVSMDQREDNTTRHLYPQKNSSSTNLHHSQSLQLPVTLQAAREDLLSWFGTMTKAFLRDYAEYLESVGMVRVPLSAEADEVAIIVASPSYFDISNDLRVETEKRLLACSLSDGLVLAEVKVEGVLASVDLFLTLESSNHSAPLLSLEQDAGNNNELALDPYSIEPSSIDSASSLHSPPPFIPSNFVSLKNCVRLDAFCFDFQLQYLVRTLHLNNRHAHSVDVVSCLRALHHHKSLKSTLNSLKSTQNFLHAASFCTNSVKMKENDAFHYLTSRASKFDFCNIFHNGRVAACYASGFDCSFGNPVVHLDLPDTRKLPFPFTLLVYPSFIGSDRINSIESTTVTSASLQLSSGKPTSNSLLHLDYYVVALNLLSEPPPSFNSSDTRLPTRQSEAQILSSCIDGARAKLQHVVDQAHAHFNRDDLWLKLVQSVDDSTVSGMTQHLDVGNARLTLNDPPPSSSNISVREFLLLSSRYNTRPLASFDPRLHALFTSTHDWNLILDRLIHHHPSISRQFNELGTLHLRHLVLVNTNNKDLLLHFILSVELNTLVSVNAVIRDIMEDSNSPETKLTELTFISCIVEWILMILWTESGL